MVKPGKIWLLGCLCALLAGCKEFPNPFAGDKVLARVGDRSLLMVDVESIFTPGLTPSDSVKLLESYVDMWVKKQLKVQEAEKLLKESQQDLDRLVEDYRNSLLSFRLDQYYVDNKLDTLFTDEDIRRYYDDHRNDFVLDRPIVRGQIVKLPESFRQKQQVKELMRSGNENDRQDLSDICQKNNLEYTEFSAWTDFAEFASHLPASARGQKGVQIRDGVQEFADGKDRYYAVITASRPVGDPNPVERVSSVIRLVLFNQRKGEIIRQYEDSIYQAAVADNRIEINLK